MAVTSLHCPVHSLAVSEGVARLLELQGQEGVVVTEEPVGRLLAGEVGAVVVDTLSGVEWPGKVLLVDCGETTEEENAAWRVVRLVGRGEGEVELVGAGEEWKGDPLLGLATVILPLAYSLAPDLVVVRCRHPWSSTAPIPRLGPRTPLSPTEAVALVHQLRAVATGRLVLVVGQAGGTHQDRGVLALLLEK